MSEPKTALEDAVDHVGEPRRGVVPITSGTVGASVHDQGLGAIIGSFLVWILVTHAGATPPVGAAAPLVYGGAAGVGAAIAGQVPGRFRGVLQSAAMMLAGLYGITIAAGQ